MNTTMFIGIGKKKVTLEFEDLLIKKIVSYSDEKAKVTFYQKAKRIVSTLIHVPLIGDEFKKSPEYIDERTKTKIIPKELLKKKKLKEGSKVKGEFIKRICSNTPFWEGQKISSSGFYISTELSTEEHVEDGDQLLRQGKMPERVIATERDLYVKENGFIKNIRIPITNKILVFDKQ